MPNDHLDLPGIRARDHMLRIDTYHLEPRYTFHELIDDGGDVAETFCHPEREPGECPYCDEEPHHAD